MKKFGMNKVKEILFIITFILLFFNIKLITLLVKIVRIKYWVPKRHNSVLFLENFPVENAGYQNRAYKWKHLLEKEGYRVNVKTLFAKRSTFEYLLSYRVKAFLLLSVIIRFVQILLSVHYKVIIVRRELLLYNDYGNLFMENFLFSLHNKKHVILDFDDDIRFSKNEGRKITLYGKLLGEKSYKFSDTLDLYQNFIVCNDFLVKIIKQNNPIAKIVKVPTCVESNNVFKIYKQTESDFVNLIWLGSNGNQKYLEDIITDLNMVNKFYSLRLIVVSGLSFKSDCAKFEIINKKWTLDKESDYLLEADIGIMPLRNTNEDKGKCGFKLLQYMSIGLVSVADCIGINKEIVIPNVTGYCVDSNGWANTLLKVIKERRKWQNIGQNAYDRVQKKYTFEANIEVYKNFLENVRNSRSLG